MRRNDISKNDMSKKNISKKDISKTDKKGIGGNKQKNKKKQTDWPAGRITATGKKRGQTEGKVSGYVKENGVKKLFKEEPYEDFNAGDRRKEQKSRKSGPWENKPKKHQKANKAQEIKNRSRGEAVAASEKCCPYRRECGSCNIFQQDYPAHLAEKQTKLIQLLNRYCEVQPIIGMDQPLHYRNKVHVVFDHDRKGNPISGVYEGGTHRVISVKNCMIHNEKADAIIESIRGMLKSFKIRTYDEDSGYGLLRHVLIRTGYHSGEIMVVLVLASPILPSKNNFVKALCKEHPDITTIVVNVNDKNTSMVLGEKEKVIYGRGYIEDTLCGKLFRISPKSFYQVNPIQTEVLYNKAIGLAGLTGKETVVDAYCGIGTIGLIASEHAKRVIGVELNKAAVRDAVMNAKCNQIENIEFYQNDAGAFLSQMAETGDRADIVFMDPPRIGCTVQFMDAVVSVRPERLIYISCNPVTLEHDLEYLTKKGYRTETVIPVDMFPWTEHVECVVLMSYNI